MTEATYEFSYAIQRLRDAIDYAQTDGDFQQARIWSNHVEAAYNADIASEQELTRNANEGAKLMHSLATGGERLVLSRLDSGADVTDAKRWQDEREPFTVRKLEVPQVLRSYASYANTGKGRVMPAEAVDGELLGE